MKLQNSKYIKAVEWVTNNIANIFFAIGFGLTVSAGIWFGAGLWLAGIVTAWLGLSFIIAAGRRIVTEQVEIKKKAFKNIMTEEISAKFKELYQAELCKNRRN